MVIESPLNVLGAAAAYSHLERLLAKMEALTGALPASYEQYEAVYRLSAACPIMFTESVALYVVLRCSTCWHKTLHNAWEMHSDVVMGMQQYVHVFSAVEGIRELTSSICWLWRPQASAHGQQRSRRTHRGTDLNSIPLFARLTRLHGRKRLPNI